MEGNFSLFYHCCPTRFTDTILHPSQQPFRQDDGAQPQGRCQRGRQPCSRVSGAGVTHPGVHVLHPLTEQQSSCNTVFTQLASSPCAQQKKQRSILMLKHNLETIQSLFLLPQEFLRIDLAWCRLLVSFRTYFTQETYTYECNFLKIKHERCHLDTSRFTYSHLNRFAASIETTHWYHHTWAKLTAHPVPNIFSSQKRDKPCSMPSTWPLPWQQIPQVTVNTLSLIQAAAHCRERLWN